MPHGLAQGQRVGMPCAVQVTDSEGRDLGDFATGRGGGYRYFGAAKTLPGVRELFEKEPPKKVCLHVDSAPA